MEHQEISQGLNKRLTGMAIFLFPSISLEVLMDSLHLNVSHSTSFVTDSQYGIWGCSVHYQFDITLSIYYISKCFETFIFQCECYLIFVLMCLEYGSRCLYSCSNLRKGALLNYLRSYSIICGQIYALMKWQMVLKLFPRLKIIYVLFNLLTCQEGSRPLMLIDCVMSTSGLLMVWH